MEIDLQTINSTSVPVKQRTDTSSRKIETTKVKARTEESVKKVQAAKDTAIKQLETEIQRTEEQRQRIDAEKYLKQIINITEVFNRKLKFSIDKELDQVIVKVVDAETDKVIKEIPPDELKRLYAKMKEAIGSIIDTMI
ncbi:MAG TPA: flagellar biosynthesis protein FlaG [Spirochaeta sp.]|nr:flagellar biosynthesis protein FlaG [Spirochaeta sp.]